MTPHAPTNELSLAASRALLAATRKPACGPVVSGHRPAACVVCGEPCSNSKGNGAGLCALCTAAGCTPRPKASKAPRAQAKPKASRVPKPRNGGKWSEAAFWGHLRSGLRRTFRFWKPAVDALHAARVPCSGPRGRKWAFRCAGCGKFFLRKQVQIDHVNPAGELRCFTDVASFIERLTPESPASFQILCTDKCHQSKTNRERSTP